MAHQEPVRNPGKVFNAIQAALAKYPDLRVGQMICNAMRKNGRDLDLFNIEDDALADLLYQVSERGFS